MAQSKLYPLSSQGFLLVVVKGYPVRHITNTEDDYVTPQPYNSLDLATTAQRYPQSLLHIKSTESYYGH